MPSARLLLGSLLRSSLLRRLGGFGGGLGGRFGSLLSSGHGNGSFVKLVSLHSQGKHSRDTGTRAAEKSRLNF